MRYFCIEKEFGIDALQLKEKEVPRPRPGEVLVRLRAAALNYRDLLVVRGSYSRNLPLPLVPLSDGAGEVVEAGEGSRWQPGDRVMGTFFQEWDGGAITAEAPKSALGGSIDGVLAEYVLFREQGVVRMPAHLSFEEGATLPCAALTAWHALESGAPSCGQIVLTLGTGGVSIFALQFARASGARVVATTGSAAKENKLTALGADTVINYTDVPDWDKRVWELTGRRGVDLVVEVGGAGTLDKSLKAVRMGGQISLIGVLAGSGEVNPLPAVMKGVRVQGIYVGSREQFEAMNRAIELHGIHPVIDRVFPFAEAQAAYRYLESGAHFGKVVIAI
ncbi:MAG TPA: NAD(P)-dependent alcohol dehydrogenase [Geobacteraceae bacterium]|jgi:NADPH:quinone reductase-like Zn-dependent oxidoreductase|nr:NAD(P)-dependent alcohol dehydrogenase [Geobacteraceae bacterium]